MTYMRAWMSLKFGQIRPLVPMATDRVIMEKTILMALSLLHTYICYTPIATFQKAGTSLDAQQSMAKQPIKGCVSNHSRTCGKSMSETSE